MYEDKISEIEKATWGGLTHQDQKAILIELYKKLDWFMENMINDYLNQNTRTILKSIKKDNPPKEVREELANYEKKHKNRKKIIKVLED